MNSIKRTRSLGALAVLWISLISPQANVFGEDDADRAWPLVAELARKAYETLNKERASVIGIQITLRSERTQAFSRAAEALEVWADKHVDKTSIRYLRARCEAGLWREYADDKGAATLRYSECEKHRAYHDKAALLAERRIDQLVPERKGALERAIAAGKQLEDVAKEEATQKKLSAIASGIKIVGLKEAIAATAAKKAKAIAEIGAYNNELKTAAEPSLRVFEKLEKKP